MGTAMYAMGTLSLAVAAVPILFLAWKILRVPFRSWLPLLVLLGLILLVQAVSVLVGEDALVALVYLIAGAGRQ